MTRKDIVHPQLRYYFIAKPLSFLKWSLCFLFSVNIIACTSGSEVKYYPRSQPRSIDDDMERRKQALYGSRTIWNTHRKWHADERTSLRKEQFRNPKYKWTPQECIEAVCDPNSPYKRGKMNLRYYPPIGQRRTYGDWEPTDKYNNLVIGLPKTKTTEE